MLKYVMVLGGNKPREDSCNYLSGIDKDGLLFSRDVDEAITLIDKDRCVYLGRTISRVFRPVDVYSVSEKISRSFEYVW